MGWLAMDVLVVDEAAQSQTNNGWAGAAAARHGGRRTVEGVNSRHFCCCDGVFLRNWRLSVNGFDVLCDEDADEDGREVCVVVMMGWSSMKATLRHR